MEKSMYQNNIKILDYYIESQRKSFRLYIFYTLALLMLAWLLLLIGQVFGTEIVKTITGCGSGFLTSLCGFSLKEYMLKKDSIGVCKMLKLNVEMNKDDEFEQSNLKKLLQNMITKNI